MPIWPNLLWSFIEIIYLTPDCNNCVLNSFLYIIDCVFSSTDRKYLHHSLLVCSPNKYNQAFYHCFDSSSKMAAIAAILIFCRKFVRTTPEPKRDTWGFYYWLQLTLHNCVPFWKLEVYDIQNAGILRILMYFPPKF